MWAKIITIKITKDLNYFSLCALNLFNTRVSQFELNYWKKWTFPQHSNLFRCTCNCKMFLQIIQIFDHQLWDRNGSRKILILKIIAWFKVTINDGTNAGGRGGERVVLASFGYWRGSMPPHKLHPCLKLIKNNQSSSYQKQTPIKHWDFI